MSFWQGSETVTIKRRSATATDEYGNKTYGITTITVKNCMVGVGGVSEGVEPNREPSDVTLTLYLPNGTPVLPGDRFIVRGVEFVKDGDAQVWEAPFDFKAGVVVMVKKRNG